MKLVLVALAILPLLPTIAHASTRTCTGDSLSLLLEMKADQISRVRVLKANDRTVAHDLLAGGARGLSGPTLSLDENLPHLYEGDFKSPSPDGLGSYTLSFSTDGAKAELAYDNDDGDMRVINMRCDEKP